MRSKEEVLEFKQQLEQRTEDFAVVVLKLLDALPKKTSTKIVAYQLGKSASSIGANYREANRGESKDDFAHKIQIALKESSETCYWLSILSRLYPEHSSKPNSVIQRLCTEAVELRNLLQSIARKVRTKR